MTLHEFVSQLYHYRVKDGPQGWDEMYQALSKTGTFSLTASPKNIELILIELLKRIEALEHAKDSSVQSIG